MYKFKYTVLWYTWSCTLLNISFIIVTFSFDMCTITLYISLTQYIFDTVKFYLHKQLIFCKFIKCSKIQQFAPLPNM